MPFPPLQIWSCIFQSCDFHPCILVPRFPVLRFPFPPFQSPLLKLHFPRVPGLSRITSIEAPPPACIRDPASIKTFSTCHTRLINFSSIGCTTIAVTVDRVLRNTFTGTLYFMEMAPHFNGTPGLYYRDPATIGDPASIRSFTVFDIVLSREEHTYKASSSSF